MKIRYRQAGENVNKLLSHVKTSNDGYKALGFAVITEATEDHRRAFYDEDEHEIANMDEADFFFLLMESRIIQAS